MKRIVERPRQETNALQTVNAADLVGFTARNRPPPAGEHGSRGCEMVGFVCVDGD